MKEKKLQQLEKSILKLRSIEKKINKKSNQVGLIRALLFFMIIILIPVSYFKFSLFLGLLIFIPIITGFIFVSFTQIKLLDYLKLLRNWMQIKKSFINRINLDWNNIEPRKLPDNINQKLIETDLDLTGQRSLHQLIDFSISNEGSLLLRDFLINHNLNEDEILKRQHIVKEILELNRFREKFLLTLSLVSKKRLDSKKLIDWIKEDSGAKSFKGVLIFMTVFSVMNFILASLVIIGILSGSWLLLSYVIYFGVYALGAKYFRNTSKDSDLIKEELGKFSRVLEFIENYDLSKTEHLKSLCKSIQDKSASPYSLLKKTSFVVSVLTFRANPFVWGIFILLFPIDFYLAYFLNEYKDKITENFESWLEVWHNLEAYVSTANFAYLNPGYNFPKIVKDEFEFKTVELGHPLIHYQKRINNSFEINKVGEAYIITGSNMSGKSTFLRTLGINVSLAYAGAPVDAKSFSLSTFKLFTCIKVSDSVIDGISYFYSEVKRLKELLDLINNNEGKPVFYLIDEIFKGTNNIERRQGSSAFIKSLTGKKCVGLVSTHDLELVNLADDNKFIINYHFKEEVQKDKMIFDYKLREGPCPTTNALKIMEIEGLPVD